MTEHLKSTITGPGEDEPVTLADVAPGSVIMGCNGTGPYLVLDSLVGTSVRERKLALLKDGNYNCCAPMSFKVRVLDVQLSYRR